jgi:hypothetical protein
MTTALRGLRIRKSRIPKEDQKSHDDRVPRLALWLGTGWHFRIE